jgi:hypothetical protein
MATITLRLGKGSPLTNSEVDANFTNINTELGTKANSSALAAYLTTTTAASTYLPLSGGTLTGNLGVGLTPTANTYLIQSNSGVRAGTSVVAQGTLQGYTGAGIFLSYESTFGRLESYDYGASAYKNIGIAPNGGNVGIGTGSPAARLHVSGTFGSQLRLQETSGTYFDIASGGRFDLKNAAGTTIVSIAQSGNPVGTQLNLNTLGDLGLGYVPNSWYSTFAAIQIGASGSSIFGRSENNSIAIGSNVYVDAAGSNTYIATNTASYYQQLNGTHAWYYAASGTAGTGITFTQVMSLSTAGALNTLGAITQNGSQVLTAGNYNSYSPTLTGTGASGTWGISITGNAATVTNGLVSTGSYANPSWITSLDASKLTGTLDNARVNGGTYSINISGTAATATSAPNYLPLAGGTLSGTLTIGAAGNTRGVYNANGDFSSFYSTEATARIQLGRDVGTGGGAGLALGGNTYALIGTGDTSGTNLYIKLSASTGTVATSPSFQFAPSGFYVGTNLALHAGNYTSYAATSGHNHTYDVNNAWLRDANDDANVKLYGNTRQMAFRTDGTTEFASGVGPYAFAWMYGGDSASQRRMLLTDAGRLWTNTHGWMDEAFAPLSHVHSYLPLAGGTLTGNLQLGGNTLQFDQSGTRSWNMFASGGGLRTTSGDGAGFLDITMSGGIRSPIYYDYNDTARYVDPNGTSTFVGLTVTNTITGSVSGSSGSTTGNAATVTNATFYRQFTVRDDRSDGGDYSLANRPTGLYAINSSGTNGPGYGYLSLIHVANSTDVAFQIAGGYTSDAMYFRGTSALQGGTGYSSWRTVLHNGNYNSYALPLSGGTLSGTLTIGSRLSLFDDGNAHIHSTSGPLWLNANDNSALYLNWQTAGFTYLGNSARSPIFYDSGNTAYYVDPNGTSNVSGDFIVNHSGSSGIQLKSTTGTQSLWIRTGWDGAPTPSVVFNNVQFQSSGSSGGGFTFWSGNTLALTVTSDYAQGAGSLRAPIFYDSNDTGYYANFADTTTSINVNGSIVINNGASSNTHGLKLNGANSRIWFDGRRAIEGDVSGANFQLGEGYTFTTIYNQTRSPIYYDSNNTAYYLDPNAGTSLVAAGNLQYGSGGANTGSFIYHGAGAGDYGVVRFYQAGSNTSTIHVFSTAWQGGTLQSTSAGSINLDGANGTTIGAWNNNDMWIDRSGNSQSRTSSRAPIFYDSGNTAYYVDPNSASLVYTLRAESQLLAGNGSQMTINYDQIWRADGGQLHIQYSAAGNINICNGGGYAYAVTSFRAPVFYDSGNTAYYTDPASTSVLNVVTANTLTGNINGMPNDGNGISGMGSASTWDARPQGVYDRYAINWHTGISLSGYPAYGGVRLYSAGYPTHASSVLRLEASSGVYTYGQFTNNSRVDAPIFYDSNNTAYYTDPNGTSALTTLTLAGNLTMNGAGSSTSIIFGDATKLINVEGYWMMFKGHQNEGFRWQTSDGSTYTTRMQLTSSALTLTGSFTASLNITAYSDERLKTNWQPMPEDYVTRLAQVKVGIYDRTDQDGETQVGVSAQSYRKLLPQAIMTAKDEMQTLSVAYGNAALASAVELAKEVVDLRNRVAQLESLINKLIGD